MKNVFAVLTVFLVLALSGTVYAWQGRMAGMGKPYGLITDESDFLIHPAKIASGEGVRYYLDYQFTYTNFIHWDSKINVTIPGPLTVPILDSNVSSGHQYDHNSLIGLSFPLAKGRMGVFFAYDNQNGDFDGDLNLLGSIPLDSGTDSHLNNYALKLMYGQPVKNLNVGVELGFAYRNEEQKARLRFAPGGVTLVEVKGLLGAVPFLVPYDSDYWELFGKLGVTKNLNTVDIDWSVYGGYILSLDSDNKNTFQAALPTVGVGVRDTMNGDVRGYRLGTDLWVRKQLKDGLSLPFLVSVGYTKKDRDGKGPLLFYTFPPLPPGAIDTGVDIKYKNIARTFEVKAGGGVEKEVKDCGLIGAGIYYNYLQSSDRLWVGGSLAGNSVYANINKFPAHKEHRLVLNLAGEQVVSPDFTLRGGLDFFYGWVRSDDVGGSLGGNIGGGSFSGGASLPLDGKTWGIEGSLGATKKFAGLTFEPFLKGGYRRFDVDGNKNFFGVVDIGLEKERSEWFTGGGLSVLFGK